ncbi:GPW/gp25 family protein [Solwaraspora sp. WMMB762]|uniref:GPW/gp25 family protein n=1 Tax=Solwaraspora sp. WMMB762 TaxID=3404120 RepID=UPI003B92450C
MSALASAADLAGTHLGGGRIRLTWTYPDDPVTHGVTFDVYSGADPLDPLRRLHASGDSALAVELAGFADGTVYLTVVARGGDRTALPARILPLTVRLPTDSVALSPPAGGTDQPAGLGFPFRIGAGGGVHADTGDPLLRGRIMQLLLTAPGERVNLPEYGTRLRDLVFDPNNEVLAAATEFAVARALMRWLGEQIQVDRVQVHSDGAELSVDILYLRKSDLRTERLRVGVPVLAAR